MPLRGSGGAKGETVSDVLQRLRDRQLQWLATAVCHRAGVLLAEVVADTSERESPAVRRARDTLWATVRQARGYSYRELGELFGRHHSAILRGVRRARHD